MEIAGGERVPKVDIEWIAPASFLPAGEDPALVADIDDPTTMLLVRTRSRGDYSTYTLTISTGGAAPAGFDPLLNRIEFSFKVECHSDFDCTLDHQCPPAALPSPPIDYLAKDFGSFRRLMLDRMSLLTPGWSDRNPADFGMTLVEAMAHVADELSYRQDAVATEAYLDTARRRRSLRRHARLVDYVVHEGCNARAWVQIEASGEGVTMPAGTQLLTRVPGMPSIVGDKSRDHMTALAAGAETFGTLETAVLYASHDVFDFWTWGDDECCLPTGTTSATLIGHHPQLKAGDVLVLAEVAGPVTGNAADADPANRTAVRLTGVVSDTDPSAGSFESPQTNMALDVTELTWDDRDALRSPLCISTKHAPGTAISKARGNIVLADHGRTISEEPLGSMPEAPQTPVGLSGSHCADESQEDIPARFRPTLTESPLTHAHAAPSRSLAGGPTTAAIKAELAALVAGPGIREWLESRSLGIDTTAPTLRGGDGVWSISDGEDTIVLRLESGRLTAYDTLIPAAGTLRRDVRKARPVISLQGESGSTTLPWHPQLDLLGSDRDAREFVVEVEHDLSATLRFGDSVHGARPDEGTQFLAKYRVGNGIAGNVGSESIAHIVTSQTDLEGCSNPLAAIGGVEPEAADAIRRDAPQAFNTQRRAVTAADYASVTERKRDVQRAAATFRWTGSWHTVFVTADRLGGETIDPDFEVDVRTHIEPFRMAGYDLEVDQPRFVPIKLGLQVCVEPDHFRPDVEEAIRERLASRHRRDGTKGLFHPDRFTFNQPVYLSAIVAEVQQVQGVTSVVVEKFQRQREDSSDAIDSGVLPMGRLEIARLDNDPNFPERGVFTLKMEGGK
jgi:hypothetical protein